MARRPTPSTDHRPPGQNTEEIARQSWWAGCRHRPTAQNSTKPGPSATPEASSGHGGHSGTAHPAPDEPGGDAGQKRKS